MKQNSDTSHALILIDDEPLRAQVAGEFRKLYKTYTSHLSDIEHHIGTVRPSYYHWMNGLFGERMEELRQLQESLVRKLGLLERMRELCIFSGLSRLAAFQQAQEEYESGLQFDETEDAFEADHDEDELGDDHSSNPSSAEEEQSDEFGDTSGWSAKTGQGLNGSLDLSDQEDVLSEESIQSKVKHYYRKLAQGLHPDLVGEQTNDMRELWQETQDAYKNRDLSHLRFLWTMMNMMKSSAEKNKELRLFDLRAAVLSLKEKLKTAKSEKRKLRRSDPSWGFGKKNKAELEVQIRIDLKKEQDSLSLAIEEIEQDLKLFSKTPRKAKTRRHKSQEVKAFASHDF